MVKHIINGCPVHLRSLTDEELGVLINGTADRLARVNEELESLCGEKLRRQAGIDIHPTLQFDLPQLHSWESRPA